MNFGDTNGKVILFQLKHLVFQADMQILLQLTRAIVICEPLPNCSGSRQPKLPSCTLTLQVFMRSVLGPRIIIRITSFLGEISCDQIASGKPETLGDWCELAIFIKGSPWNSQVSCLLLPFPLASSPDSTKNRHLESPRLTSITYFARWSEEGLDYGKDKATA